MLKNEKGISLTTMVITVLILVIILSTLVYSAYTSVKIRNLNKLYNDLRTLSDEVIVYYAENKTVPADLTTPYATVSADTTDTTLLSIITTDGTFSQNTLVNPNDYDTTAKTATYYTLDLDLLSGISLSYTGTYIINAQSLMIYYVDGVTVDDETYYNLPLSYIDTEYGVKNPVDSITVTTIYLPMNSTSVNVSVSDYYKLVAKNSEETAIAKTITYSMSSTGYETYFSLKDGVLTTETSSSTSTTLPSEVYKIKVKATNYDDTSVEETISIYLVDIKAYGSIDDSGTLSDELSSVTLKSGVAKTIYILKRGYGYDSGKFTINGSSVTGTSTGYTGIYSYNLSSSTTGTSDYSIVGNGGTLSASTAFIANVLNPTLVDEDSKTVSTVKFTSLNNKETLTLKVDGIDDSGLTVSSVSWTYTDVSSEEVSNCLVASFTKSTSSVVLTPSSFGTIYLSGTVTLSDNSTVDLDKITVSILGIKLSSSTLTLAVNEEKTISFEVASGMDRDSVGWSSSDETCVTIDEDGKMTAVKGGTSEITASITLDGVTYTDTCTVTVTK